MPNPRAMPLGLSVAAIAAFLAASPALAITAEELWADWQAQATALGQGMTAETVEPGAGGLTLRGFTATYSDGEVTTVGRMDEIVFTDNADGTVTIDPSAVYALTVSFVDEPGTPPVNVGIDVVAPDLEMTASGTAGALVYDYAASRITLEDGPITGGDGPSPVIDMLIGIEGLAARYQIDRTDPDTLRYASTSSFAGLAGAIDLTPPAPEVGRAKLVISLGATTGSGSGTLPATAQAAPADPKTPARPTVIDLDAALSYASASLELTFEHPTDAFNLFAANAGGGIEAAFGTDGIAYRLTTTGSRTHFAGPGLPVPLDYTVGSTEIAFRVPLAVQPDPQPVALRVAVRDLALGPQVWGLADPAGAIPRDPITAIADLSGSVQVLRDLMAMSPGERSALGDMGIGVSPSAELREVTLNDLRLSIGDTALTGNGSASFAPGAGPGAAAVPVPVGSVDLQLAGGNAFLDRLQGAGIVPIEQIAMARGLLAAFARPGAAPDTLESTIQFTEGGGITANGVPLQ